LRTKVAHCGFMVNTGSRDELEEEQGLAHFIEHVIFKGTRKRKAYHILSRLENVGGDLNAFTTKEDTCIYASFLSEHYERTLELFSDVVKNSTFPDKEIAKEKEVIIDEINSYKDSPFEQIYDDFEEALFMNHSLGRPILGTPEHLKRFTRKHILRFISRNYRTSQMVISSAGSIGIDELESICNTYFSDIQTTGEPNQRTQALSSAGTTLSLQKQHYQAHCIIGSGAYSANDEKRTAMILLNNLLGGPGMNTRLNMNIREKYGFCYNLESSYQPYSDTGAFSIYLGTDFEYLDKTIQLVMKELKKLREQKLGSMQLFYARQQIKGQIAIAFESNLNEMLGQGKSYLLYNRTENLNQVLKRFDAITADVLLDVANEVFAPERMVTIKYIK
jgi:predicted Zn-dependent peptidase